MNAYFTYACRFFRYARAEATFYVPVCIHFSIGYWPFSGIKLREDHLMELDQPLERRKSSPEAEFLDVIRTKS